MNTHKVNLIKTISRNKTVFTEVKQEFSRRQEYINKTFEFKDFISKNRCTSYLFGNEKIEQKAYICSKCDKKDKHFICDYCYKNCHQNCRIYSKDSLVLLKKNEYFKIQRFSCFCGLNLKHILIISQNIKKVSCTMMQLDQQLNIHPNHCISHNSLVCCICAVVCHKNCNLEKIDKIDNELECECDSDYHSNFNELALSFPLEQYKKVGNIDIWPIQILNILFSSKSTFNKMILFFNRILKNEIDFHNKNNVAIINKFEKLLELFSGSFNRKFKTYYYVEEIYNMFPFEDLINYIKNFEVIDGQTFIIKFRLLFILLFIHLKKDFNQIKSFTSNDFYCNTVLERLKLKKILKSDIIFSYNINDKYKLNEDSLVKTFVLKSLCNLITKGMNYVSVEDNQDEFEIGLKLINFMLKRMIFDKNDIILLIDSIYNFHSIFYNYIMCEKNNIYSLIEIFNGIIKICFIISIYYNDLIIEEYLNNKQFKIGKFIHSKSEHSTKLLTILLKNCDLFSYHFHILIKPYLDTKNKEEIRRDNNLRKHKLSMQNQILSGIGVKTKMPENGGLFTDKIINLFIENLSIFTLADNIYQKQLNNITNDDISMYYNFCEKIENNNFYEIMNIEPGKHHSNILYNLKIVIDEIYYNLFTTSYVKQKENLEKDLRTCVLNACDEISRTIDNFKKKSYYKNLLYKFSKREKKNSKNKNYIMDEEETLKRKILKEISGNINFAKNNFLLIEEGRNLIVDNLIISQIDEILIKGILLLSNIHYPNIINKELIELFFHFLSLFLLTKNGTIYFLTGKNLQIIQKLINRFRFDEKNKNINEEKNRTIDFNINGIKIVIHFLYILTKLIRTYNIKTIKGHKALMKYSKSILNHLKYFPNTLRTKEKELEFKMQLKESLEILNNLFPFYNYDEFEKIKINVIDLFKNLKFLNFELFQKLFDKSIINKKKEYHKIRNNEIDYYFQFFELITKNSFYVYNNDEYDKKLIKVILEFIEIQELEKLMSDLSNVMSYTQKIVLLRLIRTFYLMDYLDQVNYLHKQNLLSNNEYKTMIKNELINDTKITQYLNIPKTLRNKFTRNNKERLKYIRKYDYLNKLIIMLNIFGQQIESFPYSIINETNICIKNYIKELIISFHQINNTIFYNKNISNKILPYYYRLVVNFMNRKDVFLKILNDIDNDIDKINPNDYYYLIITENKNKDYKFISNKNFIIFNKDELFSRVIKNIYDIYNKTKINEEYSLQKYLEIYDIFNEANFPPFSLLEIKDYEYFYEGQDEGGGFQINDNDNNNNNKNKNNNLINRLEIINHNFLEQFRNISTTSFLGVLTGDLTDKKFDFGFNFTQLFASFINSTESGNIKNYRALLCILNKMLFYDCEHVQFLFKEMICDKFFFNNINRELNYYIVQYIDSSKKYELCKMCSEITDITKLTIQFLQLLGEGFNTDFHENVLKCLSEKRRLVKKKTLIRKGTIFHNDLEKNDEDNSEVSDNETIIINNVLIENSIKFSVKQEINKLNKIPLVEPESSIYETMIRNLKIIFHLMKLNNVIEGELCFDKLIILSTNIIDFLIEYIDSKKSLIDIIDSNITNLFFGKDKKNKIKNNKNKYSDIEHKGILQLFTMKIKEKENENIENNENNEDEDENNEENNKYNKYKIRKTMLAYMKIKYFQLLKAYIQLGNKKDFVKLLLQKRLGPMKLFEEAIYYMSELINNLINQDYYKYHYLLNIDSINSYKDNLKYLYMYEDSFRNSIEINLIFQICLIIKIYEDIYGITLVTEYYDKIQVIGNIKNKNDSKEKDENEINEEDDIKEKIQNININEDIIENDNKIEKGKDNENEGKINFNNNINNITNNNNTNNISNTIAPFKSKLNCLSTFNTNENIKLNNNNDNDNDNTNNINNIITLKENSKNLKYKKEKEHNKDLYIKVLNNYKKYKTIKTMKENEKRKSQKKKTKLDPSDLNLDSKFSISVYKFLISLLLKIEIKSDIDFHLNQIRKKINHKRLSISKISYEISRNIINFKNFDFFLSHRHANENYDLFEDEVRKFDDNIKNLKNIKLLDEEEEDNKITFFIKPYLSFHLSEQTKQYFLNNVDRSSAKGKYKSLVIFSDYCIFEMMYNMKYINNSKYLKKLTKVSFYYLHVINYILIIIENILLMIHYYRDYSLDYIEYNDITISILNKKFIDIIIIIIIKLIIIILASFIWFYFKFILEFQRNILFSEEASFIFRQSGRQNQNINDPIMVKYFQGNGSIIKTIELINKDINIFTKIKILIFDTILFNLDINIFIFSFILNIFFLIFGNPIILSIEVLFIVVIFPSLLNIFKAFTAKFTSLFASLIFTYCIVYIYTWISMFYMRKTFVFEDIYDYKTGKYISEPFCHSSIQCLLVLINYGTRGGGIADYLPDLSYKDNIKMFVGKFFYDITYCIFVTMIMGSVIFSLIVDTFGELRDESYNYDYDKKNICFICQISRDGCLLKNIDFNSHIKNNHNLWNYVYFLVYLHLYNPNDFSRVEGIVWDKLIENDYGWIPIDNSTGGEESDDD